MAAILIVFSGVAMMNDKNIFLRFDFYRKKQHSWHANALRMAGQKRIEADGRVYDFVLGA